MLLRKGLTQPVHPAPYQSSLTCSSRLQLFLIQAPAVHLAGLLSTDAEANNSVRSCTCHHTAHTSRAACHTARIGQDLLLDLLLLYKVGIGILQMSLQSAVFIRTRLPDGALTKMFTDFLLIWKKHGSASEVWGQTWLQHSSQHNCKVLKTNCRSLDTDSGLRWKLRGMVLKPVGLCHEECDLLVVGAHPLGVFLEKRKRSTASHLTTDNSFLKLSKQPHFCMLEESSTNQLVCAQTLAENIWTVGLPSLSVPRSERCSSTFHRQTYWSVSKRSSSVFTPCPPWSSPNRRVFRGQTQD